MVKFLLTTNSVERQGRLLKKKKKLGAMIAQSRMREEPSNVYLQRG